MKQEKRDIFKEVVESAKSVKLTERERTALFSAVDSFVKQNPIIARNPARAGEKSMQNDMRWFSFLSSSVTRMTSFAVIVFLILGGGTSFAAQNSLPGDLLYSVKVNVNEGIKGLFVGTAGQATFELERAGTRLREAEVLAKSGKLTERIKNQVEAGFETHMGRVEDSIKESKNNGDLRKALETSTKLEASLRTHEASLSDLLNEDGLENDAEVRKITDRVQRARESSSEVRTETERSIIESDKDEDVRALEETILNDLEDDSIFEQDLNLDDVDTHVDKTI